MLKNSLVITLVTLVYTISILSDNRSFVRIVLYEYSKGVVCCQNTFGSKVHHFYKCGRLLQYTFYWKIINPVSSY
jgi:hypothetical protein